MYSRALCLGFFSLDLHLFRPTVIAHSFCIVELLIYTNLINNLHMYGTLYQAGMYNTAF